MTDSILATGFSFFRSSHLVVCKTMILLLNFVSQFRPFPFDRLHMKNYRKLSRSFFGHYFYQKATDCHSQTLQLYKAKGNYSLVQNSKSQLLSQKLTLSESEIRISNKSFWTSKVSMQIVSSVKPVGSLFNSTSLCSIWNKNVIANANKKLFYASFICITFNSPPAQFSKLWPHRFWSRPDVIRTQKFETVNKAYVSSFPFASLSFKRIVHSPSPGLLNDIVPSKCLKIHIKIQRYNIFYKSLGLGKWWSEINYFSI